MRMMAGAGPRSPGGRGSKFRQRNQEASWVRCQRVLGPPSPRFRRHRGCCASRNFHRGFPELFREPVFSVEFVLETEITFMRCFIRGAGRRGVTQGFVMGPMLFRARRFCGRKSQVGEAEAQEGIFRPSFVFSRKM